VPSATSLVLLVVAAAGAGVDAALRHPVNVT